MTTRPEPALVTLEGDHVIRIVRCFAGPPAAVFRACTEPALLQRWWPAGRGEMTVCEIDLRVGGTWRYVISTTAGFEVAFHGVYREIEPDARIVSTEVYEGAPGGDESGTLNTITFEADGNGTRLTTLVEAPSPEVRDAIIASGMETGLRDAMALLALAADDA